MVAIYKNICGRPFTGMVAETEKEAWAYLDEKYGHRYNGVNLGCNHDAFTIEEVEFIKVGD